MFNFAICGLDEALIHHSLPTKIVSLICPQVELRCLGPHHLIVQMDDVETMHRHGLIVPEMIHIWHVLSFTKNLTDADRLLVHCHAGVSRSTAMMIGILMQHGVPYYEAMEHVAEARPCLMPNFKIITLLDEHFKLNGKFIKHFNEWRRREIQLPFEVRPTIGSVNNMKHILDVLAGNNIS